MPAPIIIIRAVAPAFQSQAALLAEQLQLTWSPQLDEHTASTLAENEFVLELGEQLTLRADVNGEPVRLTPDFVTGALDWRRKHGGGRGEPVVRAVWGKQREAPTVFDATGGLARDSFVLAATGCKVVAREQHPIIAALVQHALQRAANMADLSNDAALQTLLAGIDYQHGDSLQWLQTQTAGSIDVVYLDPMFPPRPGSAKVKKDMQLLQRLAEVGSGDELLQPARRVARQRVVVKRPNYAPPLAGIAPSGHLPAGANRFDIYTAVS